MAAAAAAAEVFRVSATYNEWTVSMSDEVYVEIQLLVARTRTLNILNVEIDCRLEIELAYSVEDKQEKPWSN